MTEIAVEKHPNIECVMHPNVPMLLRIYTEDGDTLAGYCLITADRIKVSEIIGVPKKRISMMWHIYVDNKYRHHGYAHRLMHAVKQGADEIIAYAVPRISEKLFVSSGFKKHGKEWKWIRNPE
jgi:N-acetylglutamate synthase-like GNAT family acetyltransferase